MGLLPKHLSTSRSVHDKCGSSSPSVRVVRKSSQEVLLALLEQGLISQCDIEAEVCPTLLERSVPSRDDVRRKEAMSITCRWRMASMLTKSAVEHLLLPSFFELCADWRSFQVQKEARKIQQPSSVESSAAHIHNPSMEPHVTYRGLHTDALPLDMGCMSGDRACSHPAVLGSTDVQSFPQPAECWESSWSAMSTLPACSLSATTELTGLLQGEVLARSWRGECLNHWPLHWPLQNPALQLSSPPALQPSSAPALQRSSAPALQPSSAPALQPSSAPALQPLEYLGTQSQMYSRKELHLHTSSSTDTTENHPGSPSLARAEVVGNSSGSSPDVSGCLKQDQRLLRACSVLSRIGKLLCLIQAKMWKCI
ncbi:uncharacterized protein LOC116091841 [Mastomys coucha]|uniref:uncharacterized protein LOC116091841 n=1 Tax=Mastomys coucha TaxID=35658 RepID=UPI001261D82B|nr:uncharacterized protein LOC116091841 [Mastomys coucha]